MKKIVKFFKKIKCFKCNGSGILEPGLICSLCRGTGEVNNL